jgi:hypothetical protein
MVTVKNVAAESTPTPQKITRNNYRDETGHDGSDDRRIESDVRIVNEDVG